ncbi:MAG: transposase [Candidatus Methylomirabilaceae bacterium]
MPRSRPPYPPEFRREAVRLYRSVKGQRSLRQVAEELGVSIESLRAWVKQTDVDEGFKDGLTTDDRQEIRRLRRENRILREEREILAKAAADPTDRCNASAGLARSLGGGRWRRWVVRDCLRSRNRSCGGAGRRGSR